jgi:uncharacterized protein
MTIGDWIAPLGGGLLIGAASVGLLLLNGRIAGISGIIGGLLNPSRGDFGWRVAFFGGLVAGGIALLFFHPGAFPDAASQPLPVLALAGALVGFGARLGSGCTSGHGVCGISRLSPRSLVATATFMSAGGLAVYAVNHLLGGL